MKRLGWGIAFAAIIPACLFLVSTGCTETEPEPECDPRCVEAALLEFPEGGLAPGAWVFEITSGDREGTCSLSVPSHPDDEPSCAGLPAHVRYITEDGVDSQHAVGIELVGLRPLFVLVTHEGTTVLERDFAIPIKPIYYYLPACEDGPICVAAHVDLWGPDHSF